MTEPNLVSVTSGPNDADKAKAYRAELLPVLEQAAQIINRASRDGLVLGFAITRDQCGIMRPGDIQVTKPL